MHRFLSATWLALSACASTAPAPTTTTPPVAAPTALPAPAPPPPASDVTTRFDFVDMARIAGHPTFTRHADGSYDEDFAFTDRGRGPSLHVRSEIGADGLPTRVQVTGTDYLHRDASESATCDAARCTWTTTIDHGEAPRAFYTTLDGGLHLSDVLLRAVRASADGSVPLLPGGRAHAEQAAEATIHKDGQALHVVAWRWTGFGLTPSYRWTDDDGRFFGSVGDWVSVVREGFSASIPDLLAVQKPLERAWRETTWKRVSHKPAAGLAIVHARLFDPVTRKTTDDATILVEGSRVKDVRAKAPAPPGYEVIDAKGKTALPGLWDMHVHVGDDDGLLDLAEGVTTVRDLGNDIDSSVARRERWDGETDLGPHLLLAGLMDSPGPYQGPTKTLVEDEKGAVAAVDAFAAKGYLQIKIYSSMKPELVPAIVKEAHAKGLRVSGHVPAHMIAEDAVNEGYDELQHINFLVLDLVGDRTTETQTPLRLSLPAAKAAGIDLDAPATKSLLDLLVAKHTVVDPTLNAFEDDWTMRPDHPSQSLAPELARLPPQVQRGARSGGLPVPDGMDATFHESFKRCEQLVKRLWERKVPIVAGTDGFQGFALHRELELYSESGIPNAEVLSIATIGAARVMKREKTSGSIAKGKDADLVLVDGDPLANMRDVRKVAAVVKSGTVIDAIAAQGALSIAPR
jgi:imidazolonepropionase-like amidohydrolase